MDKFKIDPNKVYIKEEDIKIEEILVTILLTKGIFTEEEYLEIRKVLADKKNKEIIKEMEDNPGMTLLANMFLRK